LKQKSISPTKYFKRSYGLAFEVNDLQAAIEGKEILTAPNSPSEGFTVAMILDNGAPVDLLEFRHDPSIGPSH
jgi:hypothetical protein